MFRQINDKPWTLQNGKDDLVKNRAESPLTKGTISDGKLTYRVNTADHNNELECEYRTDIYLYDSQDRACNSAIETVQADCKTVLGLPAGIKVIEEEAFMKNEIIEKVVIPSGCESIGARAFADCGSLYVVRIPASALSIDASTFSGCGNVTVYTPAGSPAETWANQHEIKVVND